MLIELLNDTTKQVGQHFRSSHFATIHRAEKLRQQVGAWLTQGANLDARESGISDQSM
jgi:hypothetical protein